MVRKGRVRASERGVRRDRNRREGQEERGREGKGRVTYVCVVFCGLGGLMSSWRDHELTGSNVLSISKDLLKIEIVVHCRLWLDHARSIRQP